MIGIRIITFVPRRNQMRYMRNRNSMMICKHCSEEVGWSSLRDGWFCGDCRTDDVEEVEVLEDGTLGEEV
jgi:hypothetical protein